ncbi:MAG: TolC family protein, partial [Myxococcaceae bacterium]
MQVRLFIFLSLWVVSNLKATELLFEEAIDRALVASRQIKLSKIDTKLATINTLKNVTLMSPQVSLGWNNTYYDSPIQFDFNGHNAVIRPQETSAGFLQVIQPLSPLIGMIQKLRADYKNQKAAEAGYELTQVEIAFGSAVAYRQIQQLGQLNQISKDRVQLSIRQEQDAAAIFRAGRINKSDLLRIRMALGGSKVAAANMQSQYESTLLAFKDLLGIELTAQIELSVLQTSPILLEADNTNPSLRLDIKAAQLTYEAAKENSWLSTASFLPNLSAFARVDKNFITPGVFM